jgi:hypothetical protein
MHECRDIDFFEAQIDDQLLPRASYDGLLTRHQFTDLGSVSLTPMHALTWGRRPSRRGVDNAEHASCPSATLPSGGPNRAPAR